MPDCSVIVEHEIFFKIYNDTPLKNQNPGDGLTDRAYF